MTYIYSPLIIARSEGYEISINEKILTTPQHNILIIPTAELAEAIAEEWKVYLIENTIRRQNIKTFGISGIYFNYLKNKTALLYKDLPPLMRMASMAIDSAKDQRPAMIENILKILKQDYLRVVLYDYTLSLKHHHYCLQLLEWFKHDYGIDFSKETLGKSDIDIVTQLLDTRNYWSLTILQYLSELTHSCILGIALSHRKIDPSIAFALINTPEMLLQKNSQIPHHQLMIRTHIIVADRFLELSGCWERNSAPPTIPGALFKNIYKEKLASIYN